MTRTLLFLTVLSAVVLAQEPAGNEKAKDADVSERITRTPEASTELAALAELRRLLPRIEDADRRKELEEKIALLEKALRSRSGGALTFEAVPLPLRLAVGREVMSGSATVDGKTWHFTLTGLGDEKYRLDARNLQPDGRPLEKIEDAGRLAELQRKHPFLEGLVVMGLPRGDARTGADGRFRIGGVEAWAPSESSTSAARPVGVVVEEPSETLRHHVADIPYGAGLVVTRVLPGSRAEKIGLKDHDILVRVNGEPIDSVDQVAKLHEEKGTVEVVRRGKTRTLDLAAASR